MYIRPLAASLSAAALAGLGVAAVATAASSDNGSANIAKYSAVPAFVAPGPAFDAGKAKGKTIVEIPVASYLPFVVNIGKAMKAIGKQVGVNVISLSNQGQPSQWVQGIEQAITQKANLIVLDTAPDPRLLAPQLAAAHKAGIPVLVTHLYPSGRTLPANVTAHVPAPFREVGMLLADGAIAATKGKANVLVIGENQFEGSRVILASLAAELKQACPACKAKTVIVPINDWATKISSETSTALNADKTINVVVGLYDAMQDQMIAGITIAGRTDVVTGSYNGVTAVIKRIQGKKTVAFTVGESANQVAYFNMDQALRILSGVPPLKNPATPFRYFDAANAAQAGVPPKDDTGYGVAYKSGFLKLWGVGAPAAAAPAAGAPAAPAAGSSSKDTFNMREFAFDTTSDSVKAGTVTISGTNKGNSVHDLFFPTLNRKTPFIQPGKTFSLVLTLKPGSYPYVCTLPRHAENGMQGVLVVK